MNDFADRSREAGTDAINLDFARTKRRGFPEAIYCGGKTPAQVANIAAQWRDKYRDSGDGPGEIGVAIFTKVDEATRKVILEQLPDAAFDEIARLAVWPGATPKITRGKVVVAYAGTSDEPIAREAAVTARYLGCEVQTIGDVGVSGIHRILEVTDTLEAADVIIVIAGMEGALASVVAGLVSTPIVAVPTSVGYGASLGGVAPLLGMLNACAPGIGVVNIDNGYGAGHLAAQIASVESNAKNSKEKK